MYIFFKIKSSQYVLKYICSLYLNEEIATLFDVSFWMDQYQFIVKQLKNTYNEAIWRILLFPPDIATLFTFKKYMLRNSIPTHVLNLWGKKWYMHWIGMFLYHENGMINVGFETVIVSVAKM